MAEDTASPLILKILSGPHLGAEATLSPGEITLGSGSDCDIVLNDQTVAPRHARVTVTATGVKLAPLDGDVMVDGAAIDDEVDLPPFLAVSLGTTNLAVGPANEVWPKIALPAGPYAPEKESGPAAAEPDAAEQGGARLEALPEDRAAASQEPPTAHRPQEAARKQGAKRRGWLPLAALILLLLLILPLLWLWQSGGERAAAPLDPAREETDVKDVLARLGLDKRITVTIEGDKVTVTGYVDTVDQLRRLNVALNRTGEPVKATVWAMDSILQAVQAALGAHEHDIVVTAVGDGALRLNGLVADRAKLNSHLAAVRADVQGIRTIDDRTLAHDEILQDLKSILREEGLVDSLQLAVKDRTVTVSGQLKPAEQEAWNIARDQFVQRYGNVVTFETQIAVIDPTAPEPVRLDVRGVSLGANEYFITGDGSWYKVGETLEDGSKVVEINDTAIILEKNGKRSAYEYRNSIRWVVEKENDG